MMRFGITVEYEEHKLTDYLVEQVVGREHTGSGTNLQTNVRDLQFEFGTRPSRRRAVDNLMCSGLPFKKVRLYRVGQDEPDKSMSMEPRRRRRFPR